MGSGGSREDPLRALPRRGARPRCRAATARPGAGARVSEPAPSVSDVQRIVAIENPVVRNLEITYCYSRLAAALSARNGEGANWCTYATWASRQAGRTIRGEDLLEHLELRLGHARWVLHPIATLWRRLLRRGLFQPRDAPRPPDERAPHAVRRVRTCERRRRARQPEGVRGDRLAVRAFSRRPAAGRSEARRSARRPAAAEQGVRALRSGCRPSAIQSGAPSSPCYANLEIGLHEQTRLQPEILEALDTATETPRDLGKRVLVALVPSATRWWPVVRRPAAAVMGVWARAIQRASSRLAREVVTDSFMVLSLPGTGARARDAPDGRIPGRARRADRSGVGRTAGAFRTGSARRRRLRRARLGRLPPADALHRAPVPRLPPERPARGRAVHSRSGRELHAGASSPREICNAG